MAHQLDLWKVCILSRNRFYTFFIEILQKVSYNWSQIITEIWVYTPDMEDHSKFGPDLNWTTVFQFPHCQTINLGHYFDFDKYAPKEVQFILGDIENLGVTLNIIETNKVSLRSLRNNYLSYAGPSLEISDLIVESGKEIEIIVKLSQILNTEKDENSQCKNYPYKNYLTYNDCDQTYVQHIIQDKVNVTPFWATQDLEKVTKIGQDFLL